MTAVAPPRVLPNPRVKTALAKARARRIAAVKARRMLSERATDCAILAIGMTLGAAMVVGGSTFALGLLPDPTTVIFELEECHDNG